MDTLTFEQYQKVAQIREYFRKELEEIKDRMIEEINGKLGAASLFSYERYKHLKNMVALYTELSESAKYKWLESQRLGGKV